MFFNYAGVCSNVLVDMGTMSKERYDNLRHLADEVKAPSKEVLEESFPAAFRRIKKLAERMGIKDYWDIRVITEYWHNEHSRIIDEKDGNYARFPETFCDYCKVHIAKVVKNLPGGFLLVECDGKQRPVLPKKYLGDVKVGEEVRIHQSEAIERFTH